MGKLTVRRNFTALPNEVVNNEELSLKAKGLYAFINSKPDGWSFSVERIGRQIKDGTGSIRSGLKELEEAGLLERVPVRTNKGFGGYDYVLHDTSVKNVSSRNLTSHSPPLSEHITLSKKELVRNTSNKDVTIADKPQGEEKPFNFKEELEAMYDSKRDDIKVIALYLYNKEIKLDNKEQLSSEIKRNVRAANGLKGYDLEKIHETMVHLESNLNFKWTLETVSKYINEDLTKSYDD